MIWIRVASVELQTANSGVAFTPVGGVATGGVYQWSRNPLYVFTLPITCFLSAWVFDSKLCWYLMAPVMCAFLMFIVVPVEEKLLMDNYGRDYAAYCDKVGRWLWFL